MKYMLAIFGREEGGDGGRQPRGDEGGDGALGRLRPGAASRPARSSPARACSRARPRPRCGSTTAASGSSPTARSPRRKEQLGGFYLIECENLDEALEWAKKVPLSDGRRDRGAAGHGLHRVRLRASRPRRGGRVVGVASRGRRPPVPARVGAGGRDPDPRPRRLRPRRGGGPGGVRGRARALARRRAFPPTPAPGSRASRATGRSTGCAANATSRPSASSCERLERDSRRRQPSPRSADRRGGACPTTGCG